MELNKEIIKGSASYTITDAAGHVLAKAHCVHVNMGMFSLVVGGRPAARGPEARIVSVMTEMVQKANNSR